MEEYCYFKDLKNFNLPPGSFQEIHQKTFFKGKVLVRISASNPVLVEIAGPRIEKVEVKGVKEFGFQVEADQDFYVGIQNRKGFFVKTSNVTVEFLMFSLKQAYDLFVKAKNLLVMLKDAPEYYDLQKESIKDLLKSLADLWGYYGYESKNMFKQLLNLIKKLERKI